MKDLIRSFGDLRASMSLAGEVRAGRDPDLQWFRASTRKLDRHNSVVEPDGFELEDFGGTFGWGHDVYGRYDGSAPPPENVLGSIDAVDQTHEFLDVGVRWAPHDLAQQVRSMIDDHFINTVSVGFIPKQYAWDVRFAEDGEPLDPQADDDEIAFVADHYRVQELLEVSVAIIPSNEEAQALAVRRCSSAGVPSRIVQDCQGAATPPASAAAIGSDAARTLRALTRLRIARGRGALES